MLYKTHMVIGLAAAEVALMTFDFTNQESMFLILFVFIGSILPDIDEQKSKINQILPSFISQLFIKYTKHRGITHSLFAIIFLLIATIFIHFYFNNMYLSVITIGLTLGYVLHILADAATYAGINNFIFNKNFKIFKQGIFVGSFKEGYLYIFLLWAHIFLFTGLITYKYL